MVKRQNLAGIEILEGWALICPNEPDYRTGKAMANGTLLGLNCFGGNGRLWNSLARTDGRSHSKLFARLLQQSRNKKIMGKVFEKRRAEIEAEEAGKWLCKTCDTFVEVEGNHCRACTQYWQDVDDGIFDDHE